MSVSYFAKIYYEDILRKLKTRLVTIDTKEKQQMYSSEITVIKMVVVLLTNLLEVEK